MTRNCDAEMAQTYMDCSPYPQLEALCPNAAYAALLMEDYAGVDGELTAIAQYLYHHIVQGNDEISKMLLGVAKVEMMHLERLGKAIVLLGGDPAFDKWSGPNIHKGLTLCERLHLDLASEYAAIALYEEHIRMIGDAQVRALLARIVLDERVHVRIFEQAIALAQVQ